VTQTYHDALQPIVAEFKNICPDITNTYVFDSNGNIVAASEKANKEQNQTRVANLNSITQANAIGGIENLTIQGAHSQLNITAMNRLYLATVASKTADPKIIKALTQTIIPTVVGLVDEITTQPQIDNQPPKKTKTENKPTPKPELPVEKSRKIKPIPKSQAPVTVTSQEEFPKATVHQLMVEKIGGLLVPSDTVRVDSEIISKWREHLKGKLIMGVNIETLEGKTTICKIKEIKNSNGKGIIQIPEKILQALQTSKGKLVKVKPIVE
jgi:predicted regulator of Ras-like GTPase activity (Roadblock/LC7/MglB family)